jgi:hypothetical protein
MSIRRDSPQKGELLDGVSPKNITGNKTGPLKLFRVDNKIGYMDEHWSVIIPPTFDFAGEFVNGLAWAVVDYVRCKFGYINQKGKYEIAPQFDNASDFSEGLAAVEISGKWGYIDISGEVVIAARFDSAGSFSEGLASVSDNANLPVNDHEQRRYKEEYGRLYDLRNRAMLDLYYLRRGYIDKSGNYRIPPQYWNACIFMDGIAAVQSGPFDKFGFINIEGKFVIEPSFSHAYANRHKGMCKWVVADADGIEYAAHEGVTVDDFIRIVTDLQKSGKIRDNIGKGWKITKRIEFPNDAAIRIKRVNIFDSVGESE